MDELTRRKILKSAAVVGASAILSAPDAAEAQQRTDEEKADRQRVLSCGLTEEEADCWEAVARAAGKFFALPELHTMDKHEVAHATHVIQHKLLSRPAYRKYLEMAKSPKK